VEKLNGKAFDSDYVLASLDIVSFFTNILYIDLALNSIDKRWIHIFIKTNIPTEKFVVAIKFVLNSIFFYL